MSRKEQLTKIIYELDFALHELNLYLDTHPTSLKAMELLKEYRNKRQAAVALYEERFGKYISTIDEVPAGSCWKWLKGPWPWENNFMEEN
ncbi:MAG: spore coat protein CotJB [Clostridia bacterium]|nr:spore coat protein CotJB [Clostridia bacterium]